MIGGSDNQPELVIVTYIIYFCLDDRFHNLL